MNTRKKKGRPFLLLSPESLPQPWTTATGECHFPGSYCYCTRTVGSLRIPTPPTPDEGPTPILLPNIQYRFQLNLKETPCLPLPPHPDST